MNWTEEVRGNMEALSVGTRMIWVEDGMHGHYAELSGGDTVESALTDYASIYEAGDEAQELTVTWILFEDGKEINYGRHSWNYQPH